MEILLGALVSVITQLIKKFIQPLGAAAVIGSVLVLSVLVGIGYYYLTLNTVLLEQLAKIALIAGGIYAFIFKQVQSDTTQG
jgi:hypothetical protein